MPQTKKKIFRRAIRQFYYGVLLLLHKNAKKSGMQVLSEAEGLLESLTEKEREDIFLQYSIFKKFFEYGSLRNEECYRKESLEKAKQFLLNTWDAKVFD